jgi:hypothetical protein
MADFYLEVIIGGKFPLQTWHAWKQDFKVPKTNSSHCQGFIGPQKGNFNIWVTLVLA